MDRLALNLSLGNHINEGLERIRLAESLGYESIWVIQIGDREATVVAAAIATATERIKIGTGVLPIYPRTPALMAQTAVTLDELSNGRFILGLGTSHKLTIETWHGMQLSKPISTMREYVQAVRAILKGEPFFGEIYKTAFSFIRYAPPRPDMPIYISCLSPKMCELAGEVADGAVLWMCAPDYIRDTIIPAIRRGAEKAGRSMDGFEIVAAVPIALTDDVAGGRDLFRRNTSIYWTLPFYRAAIEGGGFGADLAAYDRDGPSGVSDAAVDTFAGIGDEAACRKVVDSYREAGVTLPEISPFTTDNLEDTLKAVLS